MQRVVSQLGLSATDLANHLGCRHLTALNKAVVDGKLKAPVRNDPHLDAMIQRGLEHEQAYVDHMRAQGRTVLELPTDTPHPEAVTQTLDAIRSGVDVITQATLARGNWHGRADVLLRTDTPSDLGGFSYEVVDTKLARETKAGTILQLCVYTDVLRNLQGKLPLQMHVVRPGVEFIPESFRTEDFLAYFRLVRRRLEDAVGTADGGMAATYPEPVTHCDVCRWWSKCTGRRRRDDHLSLVAGISALQRGEFETHDIQTLENLGTTPLPFGWRPSRGSTDSYVRVREQARIQLEGRTTGENLYELLTVELGLGLTRLPEPSDGDIFFDIEGDAFVAPDGLEYLLGWVALDDGEWNYRHLWALDRQAERAAFETFIDQVVERWATYPDLHIYHYAPYEPSAMKRLMSRYATREDEVDQMLHAGLFVDLYHVVKQSLRASVERYSIKDLEVFFGYERETELRDAAAALRAVEVALELADATSVDPKALGEVRSYNADDCRATRGLRDWLEELRQEAIGKGADVPRPEAPTDEEPEEPDEWTTQIRPTQEQLLAGVPDEPTDRTNAQHARWVLGHMLEFYHREKKAPWWNYFRLIELSDEELLDETTAIAKLDFVDRIESTGVRPVDRYAFPAQDTNVRAGDSTRTSEGKDFGEVIRIDTVARTVDIRKGGPVADLHPTSVFSHKIIGGEIKAKSLLRIAEQIVSDGIETDGPYRAGRDLLLRRPPRFSDGTRLPVEGTDLTGTARMLGLKLSDSALAIQGPPGSGKTYTAASIAVDLIREGKTVGVTAGSHKVIRQLLDWIVRRADDDGVDVRCLHKVGSKSKEPDPRIREVSGNPPVVKALEKGTANVIGGTSWLWARADLAGAVDVLFIDEAGQLSLADAVAVSQCAKSVVLVGDPGQLEAPQQGSHPDGTGVSALEHLLDGHRTMPPDRGLFMAHTRRLAPAICEFTSEVFYEGRLSPLAGLERQVLEGNGPIAGAGLWFAPTPHEGNQSSSPEEVARIVDLFGQLTQGDTRWVNEEGQSHVLGNEDVLIVAPYNAQVSDLKQALPNARIGTVDRFQGQEAAVVIYSMTTSSQEEAPHGMEFLYSLNRLNVATSRARCAVVLVANPDVFEPECRTPQQMRLANAFCRYVEMAKEL